MIKSKAGNDPYDNYRRFSYVSKERDSPLQWEEVTQFTSKQCVAYQIAAEISNYIYIHGGVKDKTSLKPTNEFYRIDLSTFQVYNLTSNDSPSLSQHACVVLSNRYLIIIGGWNGHVRMSNIHVFDSQILKWLETPAVTGFPEKAGLSGHTANASIKIKDSFPEIIVIGREGSVKTQRRFGNGYRLACNKSLTHFTYSDLQLNLDSRSCHCACVINSKFFIIGGRDDKIIDCHKVKQLISDRPCLVVSSLVDRFKEFDFQACQITGRRKAARRGHCLIPGKDGFVVLGGSSFIDSNHIADSAGFLYMDCSGECGDYFFLGSLKIARTNGACCVTSSGDAYYHGGIGLDGSVRNELLLLKLTES